MYILNKRIIIKIIILLLVQFWKIVNSQEDVVGGPLFPKLYLAKARAMHNLAVARARARAKPHLLLQANPEYSENTKQMDFNSYVGINAFNNENFVNPYVSYYDDIKHKGSDNIETGYAKKYPYQNTNFVHHENYSTSNRMTYNTVNNQQHFLYYPNKNSEITENETNMSNQFIMSQNLQDQFENKPRIYTPSNRGDDNTLTFNTDRIDYSTKRIPLENADNDNTLNANYPGLVVKTDSVTSIPGKNSVSNINNRTILNDPDKNNFSQKDNYLLSEDLNSEIHRTEEYSQNHNNENDKSKRLNLTSYSHEPLHFDLGKLLLTNSYPESNHTLNNLMEIDNKSNEDMEDFQNFTDNNSKNIELLDSNLNLVKEDMKAVDDVFVNTSDEDDISNEANSDSHNENATNNDLQPGDYVNNEKLHQLETTIGIEDTHSTVLPISYPQGDKSNNLSNIDMITEEPNIENNLKVILSQPQRQEPKSMTLKENYSNCGMKPTIHTISLDNAKMSTINSEKNDTNASGEIQQNMTILNEENNFTNTDSVSLPKVIQNPADYYQGSKLQYPENLKSLQEMSRKQGDVQRTTNYKIYSNNRNFHNRQRDEQLYLWSLNNIENIFLQSPHPETSLKNPLAHTTIHKPRQEPISIMVIDPSKHQFFDHQKEEPNETKYRHTFDKLIHYIAEIHENKEVNAFSNTHSYTEKSKPLVTDSIFKSSKRREQTLRNNLRFPNISEDQLYPERVSSYLLHFPQNERYYGQRYRREIKDRKDKNVGKFGATSKRLPLINLITDPSAKLDVPETMKNIGSVTRNSLENENAPLYHFKNMLASAKNAVLSAMIIPSQNLLIPTQYEIIDKNTLGNEVNNIRSTTDTLKENYLNNDSDKVFQKIGSIMKQSIHSSQQALQHVSDVAHNARKAFSSTHRAIPNLLVPYIKTPAVEKEKINKLSLITPHVTKIIKEKKSHDVNDDHIKVGVVMNALGLSHPDQEQMGNIKFIFRPKKIQPKLQSRFGSNENEIPGYYITDNQLEDNKLNPDEVHEVIEILHKVKEVSGSRSLKDFLLSIKTHLESGNGNNATQFLNQNNETVGNLPLAGDLLKPFLGLLPVKQRDKINEDIERKGPKRRHISKKNDYREFDNTAFTNFIAGYEIVGSINPEVYRFYFHEPFKVNHSADVNLKEIQHEIKNSNAMIPIDDLYNTIKNSFEETKAGMDVQKSKPQEVESFPKKNS